MDDRRKRNHTARGERSGQAKLTVAQVETIRELRGQVTQEHLASRYGVCRATISHIQNGRNWRAN
jgi:DNA-binding XRE family transcriptional regulator